MPYSVTIKNDSSLVDRIGFVHTWLTLNIPGATKYFSFSNSDGLSLIGFDSPGKSSVEEHLKKRPPTEDHTINITEIQYVVLNKEFDDFYKRNPNYDLTPDNEGDYNCVTASRAILQAAGIHYLDGIQTPFGVKYKIKGGESAHALERALTARDDFDNAAKEMIRYFDVFFTKGFDSKDIHTRISFDPQRPITIPYGSKNGRFADYYLNRQGGSGKVHEAARFGHLQLVQYAVEVLGESVSAKNTMENTPLHYAARHGHLEIVKYLTNRDADFDAMNAKKMTPLHFAALGGHFKVAEYFMNLYSYVGDFNKNDDVYGGTPLHYAASSGNLQLVQFLIDKNADVNERADNNDIPLHYAVSPGGNLEIVKHLIRKGAIHSIQSSDGTPTIHYAALGGHLDIMQYLINDLHSEYDIKSNGIHTLHYAVRGGSLPVVQYLVEQKGADLNVKNNVDGTPLHDAAYRGHIDIVRYLLKKGANAQLRDQMNNTPIDCARERGHSSTVNCLQSVNYCISQRSRRDIRPAISSQQAIVPIEQNNAEFGNSVWVDGGSTSSNNIQYHPMNGLLLDGGSTLGNNIQTHPMNNYGSSNAAYVGSTSMTNNAILADVFIRKILATKHRAASSIVNEQYRQAERVLQHEHDFIQAMHRQCYFCE